MSNQEAITIIGNLEDKDILFNPCDVQDAKTMAIKALEQEPSDDIEEIREVMSCDADAETKCKMISNILMAKPHYFEEPKTGHWKSTIDGKPICSECGFVSESEDGYFVSRYCPNCGAKMESEAKE